MMPTHDNISEMTDDELYAYKDYHSKQAVLKGCNEQARKLLLNSGYGALANRYCPVYDLRLAESITKQGQLAIRWAGDVVNLNLNKMLKTDNVDYVVYTDTDSIYVKLEEVVDRMGYTDKPTMEIVDMLDMFCIKKMQAIIDNGYESLAWHCNSYSQKMQMDREVISSSSIFCTKKKYTMTVWDSEGERFVEPYIKMMGLDVIKSSTPEFVRVAMKKTITLMLNGDESDVQKYIKGFKKEFKKYNPEEIAFPKGVNNMEEKYCDGNGDLIPSVTVPINSRASMLFNKTLNDLGMDNYEHIMAGDKIKYIYLNLPNKLNSNVIGFVDVLPKEFGLHSKIDYDIMWEKVYEKPMRAIIELIGWSVKPRASLESFFS